MDVKDERGSTPPRTARLELKLGDQVHMVLEGDPAFVMEAYRQVQDDVARAVLQGSTSASQEGEPQKPRGPPELSGKASAPASDPAGRVLWIYRCEDDMRTVYATERSTFAQTRLARLYRLGRVERVYVEDERVLRALRHGARTLWRELEPQALARIKEAADKADAQRAAKKAAGIARDDQG